LGTLAEGPGCFPFDYEAYPPQSHCRPLSSAIRSLVNFGNLVRPRGYPVLYRRLRTDDAAPQCISGRTSYLRVRLAFHPYPQLIQAVFNRHWFGRPRRSYLRFPLAMGRSHGFGSTASHVGVNSTRSIRTRFRSGSASEMLNPRRTITRRFILQKARHHRGYTPALTGCRRSGFRFYFTPLPGFF
jgi:hypothetical protein